MPHEKFNIADLEKLNDPSRLADMPPEVMWSALGNPKPRTIVDIGAGTGLFAFRFAEFAPNAEVHAVDVEPVMVRWMLENRPNELSGRLRPMLASETSVPLPTGEADLVVMINLHHELVEPAKVYAEALRILRPGGQVLLVDWAPIETPKGPPPAVRASAEKLAKLLREAGFVDVAVHTPLPWHSLLTARVPGGE
jgi:SAM-dependent methyltransferase